ncbi:MAG: hypothetical protein NVSMB49_19220 [Ktedonobacteraceae bacterium]
MLTADPVVTSVLIGDVLRSFVRVTVHISRQTPPSSRQTHAAVRVYAVSKAPPFFHIIENAIRRAVQNILDAQQHECRQRLAKQRKDQRNPYHLPVLATTTFR